MIFNTHKYIHTYIQKDAYIDQSRSFFNVNDEQIVLKLINSEDTKVWRHKSAWPYMGDK